MTDQNKFEVSGKAEEVDQQWVNFKVATSETAEKQIPRVERKTKQRWMTEDILDPMEKGGKLKIIEKNTKHRMKKSVQI